MKKRVFLVLMVLFINIFFCGIVEARECHYKYEGKDLTLTFTKAETAYTMNCTYDGTDCSYSSGAGGYDRVFNFVEAGSINNDEECYGSLNVCTLTIQRSPTGALVLVGAVHPIAGIIGFIINEKTEAHFMGIFGSALDSLTIDDVAAGEFDLTSKTAWSNTFWKNRGIKCSTVDNLDKLDKENLVYYCDKYNSLIEDVSDAYASYKACGETTNSAQDREVGRCRAAAITKVNATSYELKTACNSIMQNASLTVEDACIKSCLNATESVANLRKDIEKNDINSDCSISNRLINWIRNIVKWVKYIVPVVVIILGILDFLRAIATNNDDNMKKAQGRFVKRLIAAALIFVIPFILEFILDKMGFIYSDCGVL